MQFPKSIYIVLFFISLVVNSQTLIIGNVKDHIGSLNGANITIKGQSIGDFTDIEGDYKLSCNAGTHIVRVTFVGYKSIQKTITIKENETKTLNFKLFEDANRLDDIVIVAKTKAEKLREESYAVEVIESKLFKNLSVNANEILNKISGINVRQSGGFGEDATLSLNGLSGSQVRVFIDGIPMEFFGSSLSLNNFPANLIEQIEVYKGVVPIHLSADALGGAVNITTNKGQNNFLDASYSYGSFNTHITSLNAQYREKSSGFTTRFKSFYNYSDNNYKMDVNLLNVTTGRLDENSTKVERFHDGYNSKMFWLETGFTNVKFADEFMLGFMYSDNYNETQQPETGLRDNASPFGEVFVEQSNLISTLNYSKDNFIVENLSFKNYLVNVISEYRNQNISDYNYDWLGNTTIGDTSNGELGYRKTDLTLDRRNILGNFNLGYSFSETSNAAINYSVNFLKLSGNDPYNGENNTRFSNPLSFNKQILAASYTKTLFDNKFRNTGFLKYYKYVQNSVDPNYFGDEFEEINTSLNHLGFGLASTYLWNNFQFKVSFENTLRYPDAIELFGDGAGYAANPFIEPELSSNYNLGVIYDRNFGTNSVRFSTNGFIRDSKNFIFQRLVNGREIQHQNLADVFTQGIDFSANWNLLNKLNFNIALTYIKKVDNEKSLPDGINNPTYEIRIPNEPYFFGNISLSYLKNDMITKDDSLSVTINENFVNEFFYTWENLGNANDKAVIPQQLTTDIETVYSFKNQKYNVSFGVVNLFDTKTYDNLFQQNPKRSYNFKLRYFIN